MRWLDVHTHLHMLEGDVDGQLKAASDAGVAGVITIGTTPEDNGTVVAHAEKYFPKVACAVGIHPHDSSHISAEAEANLRAWAKMPCVVAIGEIGLDYYYKNSEPESQKQAFRSQMEIAKEARLPVEIHTREAEEDSYEIMKDFSPAVRGVLHCFTGTLPFAKKMLDLGYNISFSGIVTFKNADSLREVLAYVPLDRLHVETDAPFLAPVPQRGKKNIPAFLPHTAQFVADQKNIAPEKLSEQLWKNAVQMFPRWTIS